VQEKSGIDSIELGVYVRKNFRNEPQICRITGLVYEYNRY